MNRIFSLLCIFVLLLSTSVLADTWYVNPEGTGDAPTIQAAVAAASFGDTLILADGTFTGPGNRDITSGKVLFITSESNDPEACIIDCEGSAAEPHRGFTFNDFDMGRSHLIGVTITNGWHDIGGAIRSEYSFFTLRNCRFINNHADYGGAVHVETVESVTLIEDCLFMDNSAVNYGGALFSSYPRTYCDVRYCTFAGNLAGVLGGVSYFDLYLDWAGGASYRRCTMVYNTAPMGCTVWDCGWYEGMSNCILAYNESDPENWIGNCDASCCCVYANVGVVGEPTGSNFDACPSFCNAPMGDFHLCDESPCAPGNHPNGYDCGLIGAWDVGCSCGPTGTEASSWGSIKSMYR